MLTGEIIAVATFNEGFFRLRDSAGLVYQCYVCNREDWDKLYDMMNRDSVTIQVRDTITDTILAVNI